MSFINIFIYLDNFVVLEITSRSSFFIQVQSRKTKFSRTLANVVFGIAKAQNQILVFNFDKIVLLWTAITDKKLMATW